MREYPPAWGAVRIPVESFDRRGRQCLGNFDGVVEVNWNRRTRRNDVVRGYGSELRVVRGQQRGDRGAESRPAPSTVATPAQDSTPWRCGPKWRSNARNLWDDWTPA